MENNFQNTANEQDNSGMSLKKGREKPLRAGVKECGRLDGRTDASFFLNFIKKLSIDRRFIKPLKYRIALAKDESLVFYILSYIGRTVLSLEIATYGIFLLLFSITSFFTEAARTLINTRDIYSIDYTVAIRSIILLILATVLVFGGRSKNLSEGILGSSILSFVLLDMLGVRRESIQIPEKRISGSYVAILLGVVMGLMTLVYSPTALFRSLFLLILGIIIINVPESGIVMTFFAIPFLDAIHMYSLVCFVWICYIMKLLIGKRSFKLTFTDSTVIYFGILMLLAGVFGFGGNLYESGILSLVTVFCFLLVSTLIKNRKWVARCRGAVVLSAEIYGIISVLGTVVKYVSERMLHGTSVAAYIPENLPTVTRQTGLYLLLAIFFVFSSFRLNGEKKGGLRIVFMSAVLIAAIVLSFSWEIWLSFIAGACFYSIYKNRRSVILILLIAAVTVALFFLLPEDIVDSVLEISGFSVDDISVKLQDNIALLKSTNIFGGSGLSHSAIRAEMSEYLAEGHIPSLEGVSTLLMLFAQLGLFGALLFIFIFLLIIGSYSVWGRSYRADKGLASVGASGFASFFAIFFLGITENIFQSSSVSVLFWLIAGLVYASCKVMKDEAYGNETGDEAVCYVEKARSEVKSDAN